jgi:hypothetical protein
VGVGVLCAWAWDCARQLAQKIKKAIAAKARQEKRVFLNRKKPPQIRATENSRRKFS